MLLGSAPTTLPLYVCGGRDPKITVHALAEIRKLEGSRCEMMIKVTDLRFPFLTDSMLSKKFIPSSPEVVILPVTNIQVFKRFSTLQNRLTPYQTMGVAPAGPGGMGCVVSVSFRNIRCQSHCMLLARWMQIARKLSIGQSAHVPKNSSSTSAPD